VVTHNRRRMTDLRLPYLARRKFASLMAASAIGSLLAPMAARATGLRTQPLYYTWQGYDDGQFFPDYVRRNGMPVVQVYYNEAEAFETLRNGLAADVAYPCNQSVIHWRDSGLLQPIDVSRLSNWPDVFSQMKSLPGAQADGRQWFVPVEWGTTSIIYRKDLVDIQEASFSLLWDQRYAGRLAIGEDASDTVVIAGLLTGAADPYDMTDDELARAARLLRQQRPLLRSYWIEPADVERGLASGEIVAATAWNESYRNLRRQGVDVAYMAPKEGSLCYCCGSVLMASASVTDLAYELMDAMLAPAAGKNLIEQLGYAHANRQTYDIADAQVIADLDLPTDAEGMLARGHMSRSLRRPALYQQTLDAVIAGAD